jgi:hypothetical protein
MTPIYVLHGLRARSEVPIDAPAESSPDPDLDIKWGSRREIPDAPAPGDVLVLLELPGASSSLAFDGNRYTLRAHGLCDFEIDRELKSACVHLSPGADEEWGSLLVGNLLTTVLMLRGHSVLHASAVEIAGRSLAFVAGVGMGKSTVAALCCAAGANLVTDDVLRVEVEGDEGWCYRGSLELRLREQAAELARGLDGTGQRSTVDGRVATRLMGSRPERLPLGAIAIPVCEHDSDELKVVRLRGIEALIELVSCPRIVGWTTTEPARRDFRVLAQIADHLPIYRAHLPWGPPFPPDLGEQLLARLV